MGKLARMLLKYTSINNYAIKLEQSKLLSYAFIYNLMLIKLKTLKTYPKTNFVYIFICILKFSVRNVLLFLQKIDRSF